MTHKWAILASLLLCMPAIPADAQGIDTKSVVRPAGVRPATMPSKEALALGQKLYGDEKLSTNGMSCMSCHANFEAFNDTFKKPFPHFVQMANDAAGLKTATAENMVQICMIAPMEAEPLPWGSKELRALTAYVEKLRGDFAKR